MCLGFFLAKEDGLLGKEILGTIDDMLSEIPFLKPKYDREGNEDLNEINNKINNLFSEATKHNILKFEKQNNVNLKIDDFVENSIIVENKNRFNVDVNSSFYLSKYKNKKWGKRI